LGAAGRFTDLPSRCKAAPRYESSKQPRNPAIKMQKKNDNGNKKKNALSVAMKALPTTAQMVPCRLTPPSVPGATGSKVVIRKVESDLLLRSSVAQVSAVATATAERAPAKNAGSCVKIGRASCREGVWLARADVSEV